MRTVVEKSDVISQHGDVRVQRVPPYTALYSGSQLLMMDVPSERKVNQLVGERCYGAVAICGLGLGLFLKPLLQNSRVGGITIFEKDCDVVHALLKYKPEMGAPHLATFCIDALSAPLALLAPAGVKYHCVHFDIWSVAGRYDVNVRRAQLAELDALREAWRPVLHDGARVTAWLGGRLRELS